MNTGEIILLIVSAGLVLAGGVLGWRRGAAAQLRALLVTFLGVLVALRYWQPLTATAASGLEFDARWVALGAFVALYLLGAAAAAFAVNLRAPRFKSVAPDPVLALVGAAAGLVTGALLAATVLMLVNVAAPGRFESLGPLRALAAGPVSLFRGLEGGIAGVSETSPSRTAFPVGAADGLEWR